MSELVRCTKCERLLQPSQFYDKRKQCRRCYNDAGIAAKSAKTDKALTERIKAAASGLLERELTPEDRACVDALLAHGSVAKAAKAYGITPEAMRHNLREIERGGARSGISPTDDARGTAPIGFHVKGKSTLYDGDGRVVQTWVKTAKDQESKLEALLDAVKSGLASIQPERITIAPRHTMDEDLLSVYPLGDPHLGMLAWPAETGNAFDLEIAERNLFAAVDHLVNLAPPSREGLLINLGDFFHADSKSGTTTRGTRVDVDSRWPKVLATGIRLMRRMITRMLEKHERVTVICEIGNHDDHSAIMLALCLAQFYENEPRVVIDTSPAGCHWYRFGKVLIGTHHGHDLKLEALGEIMSVDQRKAWGESEFCYWYVGHVHHTSVKELRGAVVETMRTLAGKDDWHSRQGYRAGRSMSLIVHHRDRGEVDRHTVGISYLESLGEAN